MSATKEAVLQGVRNWIKAYADEAGGALTDAQVIVGNENLGGRPASPYFSVFVETHSIVTGMDEVLTYFDGGAAVFDVQGERFSTVQVHAYGDFEAELENLVSSLHRYDVHRTWADDGVTILSPLTGPRSVPQMRNANLEKHNVAVFPVHFRFRWGPFSGTEVDVVNVDLLVKDSDDLTTLTTAASVTGLP